MVQEQLSRSKHDQKAQIKTREDRILDSILLGSSNGIKALKSQIIAVSKSDQPVMVLGESGTGKELVARLVHQLSDRTNEPFVPVNCAAIPAELIESEFFGHDKGAFTGAITARRGRIELAGNGTLFLDEIGDMPVSLQAKLLRFLQERTYERVGGSTQRKSSARIVAATHRNLRQEVNAGRFREDLYYRLCVLPVTTTTLRQNMNDLSDLIRSFVVRFNNSNEQELEFDESALRALRLYHWPGNVRELQNLIVRLSIMCRSRRVTFADLPEYIRAVDTIEDLNTECSDNCITDSTTSVSTKKNIDLREYLRKTERDLLLHALKENQGVVAASARFLCIRRTTLIDKLKRHKISVEKIGKRSELAESLQL